MKRKYVILIHILNFLYIINMETFPVFFKEIKLPPEFYWLLPVNIILDMINFYLVYLLLIPLFSKIRIVFLGFLYGILTLLLFTIFRIIIFGIYDKLIFQMSYEAFIKLLDNYHIYAEVRTTLVIGLYALLIRLSINWVNTQKQQMELIRQNQTSELALLRSQVSPHFLFNTLNNIYSLVYQKSDLAPDAVMKLSSIMRYMLYESDKEFVPLEKEIEYLKSYIDLQQLRIKNENFVLFNLHGNTNNRSIPPMLFIPFVENAFKHGNKKVASPGIIIKLHIEEDELLFTIKNFRQYTDNILDETGGIGLQNIRRRLELLYPGKFSLDILESNEFYDVRLIIRGEDSGVTKIQE